jgi:hypothetical protein
MGFNRGDGVGGTLETGKNLSKNATTEQNELQRSAE